MVDFAVVPERTALINVDLQNCFVAGAPDGLATMDRINRLAAMCREEGFSNFAPPLHASAEAGPRAQNVNVLGVSEPSLPSGMQIVSRSYVVRKVEAADRAKSEVLEQSSRRLTRAPGLRG